jgi:hypothetical protein
MNGPENNDKPPMALVRTAFSERKYKRSDYMGDHSLFRFINSHYQLA